jgi:hypothetical protein
VRDGASWEVSVSSAGEGEKLRSPRKRVRPLMAPQTVKQADTRRFITGESQHLQTGIINRTDERPFITILNSMYKETSGNGRAEAGLSGLHRHPLIEISKRLGNAGKIKGIECGDRPAMLLNHLSHRTV